MKKKWPIVPGGDSRILSVIEGQEAREDLVKRIERELDLGTVGRGSAARPQAGRVADLGGVSPGGRGRSTRHRGSLSPLGMRNVANVSMAKRNVLRMLREEVKNLEGRQGMT